MKFRHPALLAVVAGLLGVAGVAPVVASPQALTSDLTALQREVIGALSGEIEIRPGVKLADRFTVENKTEARTYLVAVFKRLGLDAKRQTYAADGENIWATLRSGQPSAETIVIGAHYDSARNAPGANDDATGVAAVMGLAQALTKMTPRSRDVIFVCFDQEEPGLFGSRAFAQMLKAESRSIHSVHTIDQMGWDQNQNRAIELEIPYDGAEALYRAAANSLHLNIPIYATAENVSDHRPFRDLGFKSVGITEEYRHGDTTPFIHTPGDTFRTIDFDYLASATRVMTAVLRMLLIAR